MKDETKAKLMFLSLIGFLYSAFLFPFALSDSNYLAMAILGIIWLVAGITFEITGLQLDIFGLRSPNAQTKEEH